MGNYPLVADEIDAGEDLARRVHERVPLVAAFWLRPEPEDRLYFYLASEAANDSRGPVYSVVGQLEAEAPTPYLDPAYVKVIGANDPLAQAATYLLSRFRLAKPLHRRGRPFGNSTVDEFCLYPLPAPVAAPGPTA